MGFFFNSSTSSSSSKPKSKSQPVKKGKPKKHQHQHRSAPAKRPTAPDTRAPQQWEEDAAAAATPPAMPPRPPPGRGDRSAATPAEENQEQQHAQARLQLGAPVTIHNHYYITPHNFQEQQHLTCVPPPSHPPPRHIYSSSHSVLYDGTLPQCALQQNVPAQLQHFSPPAHHVQPIGLSPGVPRADVSPSEEREEEQQQPCNDHSSGNPNGPDPSRLQKSTRAAGGSVMDLARAAAQMPNCGASMSAWYEYGSQVASTYAAACDEVMGRFNSVLGLDGGGLTEGEMDVAAREHARSMPATTTMTATSRAVVAPEAGREQRQVGRGVRAGNRGKHSAANVAAAVVTGSYFSKAEYYANSHLPADLPPFAVYMPTWPLLTLAAQYSLSVYSPAAPHPHAAESRVPADWRTGSKAMSITSVSMDSMHTVVFAIRGTASLADWAVNLQHTPRSAAGFLDDEGNLCHAGFLSVARRMVPGVAARLRQLLDEDPSRARYSLLLTGHSAGGAVASLLYCHMLSRSAGAASELRRLTACFKRVHCVTFGTPPVSILPLRKPDGRGLRNSLFLSFVNEGDPVARVDKAYVKTLLELLASDTPGSRRQRQKQPPSKSRRERQEEEEEEEERREKPTWDVPPCTLCNPGRVVVMRSARWDADDDRDAGRGDHKTMRERLAEGVAAHVVDEEQLRGVIWADPVAHLMRLYAGRIEALAVAAVMVQGQQGQQGRITDRRT
ncbi:hypothetical protein N3K66_007848 [Trichothecium roseum]|uniref:Uncharacterized protein n=1 Tax=Trichothecium roseum TaxID=47278 RepID=A0ACC0URW5_9HYPO|nr:hypothetical protein N3K66_007848 [Trichothecium roseum]